MQLRYDDGAERNRPAWSSSGNAASAGLQRVVAAGLADERTGAHLLLAVASRWASAAPQPTTTTDRQATNAVIGHRAAMTPAAVSRW